MRQEEQRERAGSERAGLGRLPLLAPLAAVGYALFLLFLARLAADPTRDPTHDPGELRTLLAAGSIAAGLVYLAGMALLARRARTVPLLWLVATGLLARLVLCAAPPFLEDDYFRYLWDGAVTTRGLDPYRHAPAELLAGRVEGEDATALLELAARREDVLGRINHPHLRTIYPPLAQALFALSAWIDPFGVGGWRALLFLCDALTFLLLLACLRALRLPVADLGWYAWNPILLREGYSALHMDLLVLPFVAGAVLLGLRARPRAAALSCVLGSAIKVWPLLLVPLVLRVRSLGRRALVTSTAFLASAALLVWSPALLAQHDEGSGLVAYGRGWQNNDGFFRAGLWLVERVLELPGVPAWHSHMVMRLVAVALVLVVTAVQVIRLRSPEELPRRALWIVGALFLLSPTQFPWYWLWCLPLLVLAPSGPLLTYAALLPLYHLQERSSIVLWLEHAPVWVLLAVSWLCRALRWSRARGRAVRAPVLPGPPGG